MYEYQGYRNMGNFTEFLISGYKDVEAEEIPKEGSMFRPIRKNLERSYKRLAELADANPFQALLLIGGVVLFMILSCACSGYLIYKISKEPGEENQDINKLAQKENSRKLNEADKQKSFEVSDEIAQQKKEQ